MFEGFRNTEKNDAIAAENRERNFVRERDNFQTTKEDDQSYFHNQELRTDLLRWQQELDDEILSVVNTLRGRQKFGDDLVQVSNPMCNEEFITQVIIPACKPFMTRNNINSNLNERIILNRLKTTANTVADAMCDNYDKYEIDFTNYDTILNEVKATIEAGAFRALNGWTKKIDSTMIKRIEASNEQTEKEKKKGIFGVFNSG